MKNPSIERDEKGNLVSWYGFSICENSDEKSCHVDFFSGDEPNVATLFVNGEAIEKINYAFFYNENIAAKKVIHTENEIAGFILHECRKHVPHRKIFIDTFTAENVKLAGEIADFMKDSERSVEEYFSEKDFEE